MTINAEYLTAFLVELLQTPSPTGDTDAGMACVERALAAMEIPSRRTPKGALIATLDGRAADAPRAVTAHVDTLGAMVKDVRANGRLGLSALGGYAWNAVEGENVTITTEAHGAYRGTVQMVNASIHVHGPSISDAHRDASSMEVRLDARTSSAEDTFALGISTGDYVSFDPRVEQVGGFIKSRHLDDKAGVACVIAAVRALRDAGTLPAQRVTLHFSSYEEVGHGGAAGFPPDLAELLTIDMAAIGAGQTSDEYHCSLCVKDSGGPYSKAFNTKLRRLAEAHGIDLRRDIYPHYGSDGEAYWRAGGDVQVALIGPGVDGSHGYERTHTDALVDTARLVGYYLAAE